MFLHFPYTTYCQSGSIKLGSQITNGIMTNGCAGSCVTNVVESDPSFICNPSGINEHSVQTMTHSIFVPQGNYLQLTVVTNACNLGTDGLDSGDSFSINGMTIVAGNSNTRVNYSGCFVNNGAGDLSIPLTLIANRRDETVTINWAIFPTNPGGNCNSASPLPVKFSQFNIKNQINKTFLSFSTGSETNNDFFNIERSTDGRSFDAIGEIQGAGNSAEEKYYDFTDETPLPGINYYRIKQTDFDGQYSYSEIRSVRHTGKGNVAISPRSTDGRLDISTEMESYDVAVYSSAGQEVARFAALSGHQTVSIEALQAGIYFVKVMSGAESETVRVVKF